MGTSRRRRNHVVHGGSSPAHTCGPRNYYLLVAGLVFPGLHQHVGRPLIRRGGRVANNIETQQGCTKLATMIIIMEERMRKIFRAFREAGERLAERTVSEAADGWI